MSTYEATMSNGQTFLIYGMQVPLEQVTGYVQTQIDGLVLQLNTAQIVTYREIEP